MDLLMQQMLKVKLMRQRLTGLGSVPKLMGLLMQLKLKVKLMRQM
jgi:hypothetical protein